MTKNQKIFVDEYLIDLNATRAYKTAYPNIKNDVVAATNGGRLLRNAQIKIEIEKRMKEREKRTEITQDISDAVCRSSNDSRGSTCFDSEKEKKRIESTLSFVHCG